MSPDSEELYFVSGALANRFIYRAYFNDPDEPQSGVHSPEIIHAINAPADEWPPCMSPDGRALLWSHRPWSGSPPVPPGHGGADLWMAVRASRTAPFGAPTNLPSPPNDTGAQAFPFLSWDGRTLLFSTLDTRIWRADACFAAALLPAFTISEHPTVGEDVSLDATPSTFARTWPPELAAQP